MTVWIYVDSRKQVGDEDHLKVFADQDANVKILLPFRNGCSGYCCIAGFTRARLRHLAALILRTVLGIILSLANRCA